MLTKHLRTIVALGSLWGIACCGIATAAAPEETAPRPTVRIEQTRPSIFYLPDRQGDLQPVLDFSYQDFVELYRLKHQLDLRNEPPRYSLQRMTVSGEAKDEYAELKVNFVVSIRDDGWVRVPLRLDQAMLRGEVEHQGSGQQFLYYEADGDGYVGWLQGKAGSQHEMTLSMLVPLTLAGDETRLSLTAPRATASELKLKVPVPGAVGRASQGATLLRSAAARDGATEFSVVGLAGDFQLAWRKTSPREAEAALVLEASGTILTKLSARSIATEAVLSVRSHGAPFDRFTVRLPPEAEWSGGKSNGYVATPLEWAPGPLGRQQLVEVRLPKKTAGPVEVRLASRRPYDPANQPEGCELAGFEVLGATRQWGAAAVSVGGEWQVLWGASSDIRPLDPLPQALRKDGVVAGFEYSVQPYSLHARLTPRKTRVRVEPKYVMHVRRDAIRLEGKLTCTVRGAKVTALDLEMPGWKLDEIGPEDLVAFDGVARTGDTVNIPLLHPASGALELELRAHRPLAPDAASIDVSLPKTSNGSDGQATLTVVAADPIELEPNSRLCEGLVRQQNVSGMESWSDRAKPPLFYQGDGGPMRFAADLRVRTGNVAECPATVQRAWIQTWLTYSSRQDRAVYQLTAPCRELEVALPQGAAVDQATVSVDGKSVEHRVLSDGRLLVPLADRARRLCTLELRYHFSDSRPPRGDIELDFPRLGTQTWLRRMYWQLVLPVNEHLMSNPEGFAGEFRWQWRGLYWGRRPLLDQSQLETWSGATTRAALPEQSNAYLFSACGEVTRVALRTAGRTWIVLCASGAALVVGLLLIYVPVVRRPPVWMALCVALAAAGLIAPEPSLLLAQAAGLGLALALAAGLLERGAARRRRRRTVSRNEPKSARIDLGSTRAPLVVASAPPASTDMLPSVGPPREDNVEP